MAATATRLRTAAKNGRPVKDANFMPKRERKRVRKSLVRGYLANKATEIRVAGQDRAAFYRGLREKKMRRRQIASEVAALADLAGGLYREVRRIGDRVPEVDPAYVDEAIALVKTACGAVSAGADEFHAFSRRRIWYTEAVGH